MNSDTVTKTKLEGSSSRGMDDPSPALREIASAGSVDLGYLSSDANAIDDAILRAQGHKAAMPRLFSAVSSLGLMFWYFL